MKIAIWRRYRVYGPVTRMMATPASSFARFVTAALAKNKEASAPLDEDEASDADTTVSRASTLTKQLLAAAHAYRTESGVPSPVAGFW